MKFAKLIHNPGAGEGELSKKELISMMESAGFSCSYSSTKNKGWEKLESAETDFIVLAGGDGTVRKVSEELLDKTLLEKKLPIGLLPLGTANNIAKTLGIHGDPAAIMQSWTKDLRKKFDVGRIYGMKKARFFLESFGFGLFPTLINAMEKQDKKDIDTPEKSIQTALRVLHQLVLDEPACFGKITINGVEHEGKFLMVEVMNTASIGPNLKLAPLADPGDGTFEVVMITEKQRDELADYVQQKINGKEATSFFSTIPTNQLKINWQGASAHVDDEYINVKKPDEVKIELLQGLLEFYVPDPWKNASVKAM